MGANLEITEKLQNYINDFGLKLNPVQQEIINYNNIQKTLSYRCSIFNTKNALLL